MKNIITLLLIILPLLSFAQQADTQVGQLVNSGNWLELNKVYPGLKSSMQSPMLKDVAEGMLGYEFNRPKQATDALYDLLQNHQSEVGGSLYSFVIVLGKVLKQHGNYAQATSIVGALADALKGQPQMGMVKTINDYNRELQAIKNLPAFTIKHPDNDVVLNSDDKWTLPVTIHGKNYKFTLRQNTEYTTIPRNVANELGLKIFPDTFLHLNMPVQIAVIDSIQIDGITVRNMLVDIPFGNNGQCMLGRDFMREVGETQLDFDNYQIIFPSTFTPMPETGSNFTWDVDVNVNSGHHRIAINYKDMFLKELGAKDANTSSLNGEHELNGVTVSGVRHLVKSDMGMLTYDIKNDDDSKTKSLFDMLRKVPMVTIDGQDNILVKGSSAFKFYRNGHPDPSLTGSTTKNVLKSIPASSISKVEVITEPGAKYDAEGTTSIINIVTLDNTNFGGAVMNLSSTLDARGSTQSSVYGATQVGKLILSGTYGYTHVTPDEQRSDTRSETLYKASGELLKSESHSEGHGDVHYLNIGASYDIDSLNLLSFSLAGSVIPFHSEGWSALSRYDRSGSPLYSYKSDGVAPTNYRNLNTRLDFQHKTHRDGEMLTASYMLSTYRNRSTSDAKYSDMVNMPVDYSGFSYNGKANFQEHTFQLDYVLPLNKSNKIETGAKYIYRLTKSNSDILYNGTSDDDLTLFNHTSQIAAIYGVWSLTTKHFSMRLGLRYEYTFMKGSYRDGVTPSFHQNLNDWVPSLNLQWKFSDARNLQLSYLTVISRPGIEYLNPAVVSTPETRQFGNSHLKSTHFNQAVLTYTTVKPKYFNQVVGAYGFSNKAYVNTQYVDDGIQVYTYDNSAKYRMSAIIDYFQWMPSPKTTLSANASLSWLDMKNPSIDITNVGWYGNLGCNLSQKMLWNLRLNIGLSTTYGKPPSMYGVSANSHSDYLTLQRSFLKDKLTISLFSSCLFEPHKAITTKNVRGDYTGFTRTLSRARNFGVTVSLQLGKMKAKVKKADRTIQNDDIVGGSAPAVQQNKLGE